MRFLLPIIILVSALGCRHGHGSWRHVPPKVERLEEAVVILQEEIDLLTRNINRVLKEEPGPVPAGVARARKAYPQSQRIRDLRTMLEILERRRFALDSELKAYANEVYDRF